MNILPHKSWHVRTKKNIARVRKDEAKAAEEVKEQQRKIALATQESRTAILRQRASGRLASASAAIDVPISDLTIPLAPVTDIIQTDGHVNFFQDLEEGKRQGGSNAEAVEEKKKEQEEYEKKIGYLVYLGQDSESNKQKPWYATIQRGGGGSTDTGASSKDVDAIKEFEKSGYLQGLTKDCKLTPDELKLAKLKSFQDPLQNIRKYLKTPGVAQKLEERSKKSTSKIPSPPPTPKKPKKKLKKEKKSKHKKHKKEKHSRKHSNSESADSDPPSSDEEEKKKKKSLLEKLRAERLQREREERRRTEQLLSKLRGDPDPEKLRKEEDAKNAVEGIVKGRVKQVYNSQFNPQLARQNYDYS